MKKLPAVLAYCFVALITFATFREVVRHDFITFDDPVYVTQNSKVISGPTADSLSWALTTFHSGNWHPVTWVSHMLDARLFGLDPAWHHFTSLFLHMVTALLLMAFLHLATRRLWPSLAVALLFAVHPLHVESVAWVSERKDVLSALWWMVTLLVYVRYAEKPGGGRYAAVVGCYAMALMSKPMVVTLPLILLLLDYWPLQRLGFSSAATAAPSPVPLGKALLEKAPLAILAVITGVLTFVAQKRSGATDPLEPTSFFTDAGNAIISYGRYLLKTFWPTKLAFFYPFDAAAVTPLSVAIPGVLLLALTGVCLSQGKRRRYLAAGWLWFLVTLLPVIGILRVGEQGMADRYTYLPLTGIFIILAFGSEELTANWRHRRLFWGVTGGILLLCLAGLAERQVRSWRDSISLYRHALAVTENNWTAHSIWERC